MAAEDRVPMGGLSRVRGQSEPPLCDLTVFSLLEQTAKQFPEASAAVFCEQAIRLSWSALVDQVEQAAAGLWALGVRRGGRVGIWSPNRAEWLLTQFATARVGSILVNIQSCLSEG